MDNNTQLAQRKKIEGTPFYMIKQTTDNDKDRYFLVMGDYRLTEPTETEEETTQKLKTEHWNIVCNIIAITTEKMIEQKPYEKTIDQLIQEQGGLIPKDLQDNYDILTK